MNVTSSSLIKAAGAAAAVAGAIFIAVQVNHPLPDSFTTETAQWVARESAKIVMAALALAGITGMYLSQYRKAGLARPGRLPRLRRRLPRHVLRPGHRRDRPPQLVDTQPGFVNDVVAAAAGDAPHGDIGGLQVLFNLTGAGYLLGGLLFGIALFRTGVLARWAAALLAVSTVGTATLAVLPESFNRPMAVPEGIALIALGVSLWRTTGRAGSSAADPTTGVAEVARAAVR